MRSILTMFLVLVAFVACGGGGGSDPTPGSDTPVATDNGPGTDTPQVEDTAQPQDVPPVEDTFVPPVDPGTPPDDVPAVDPGTPGGDCIAILTCVQEKKCQDAVCTKTCIDAGTPDGQTQFMAMAACQQSKCAGKTQPSDLAACLYLDCGDVFKPCVKTGAKTCMQMLTCVQGCKDATCQQTCLADGSFEAQVAMIKISVCLQKNCADVMNDQQKAAQCLQSKCMAEAMACAM